MTTQNFDPTKRKPGYEDIFNSTNGFRWADYYKLPPPDQADFKRRAAIKFPVFGSKGCSLS